MDGVTICGGTLTTRAVPSRSTTATLVLPNDCKIRVKTSPDEAGSGSGRRVGDDVDAGGGVGRCVGGDVGTRAPCESTCALAEPGNPHRSSVTPSTPALIRLERNTLATIASMSRGVPAGVEAFSEGKASPLDGPNRTRSGIGGNAR